MDARATVRLDARFTHLVTWDGGGVLVGDEDFVLLHDELVLDVVTLTKEPTTEERVLDDLSRHDARHVWYALVSLQEEGVLTTTAAALDRRRRSVGGVARELADAWAGRSSPAVALDVDVGGTHMGRFRSVLTDDYLHPRVATLVAAEHAAGRDVRLLRVAARSAWVGPWLPVEGRGCLQCLSTRLRLNAPARTLLYRGDGGAEPDWQVMDLGRDLDLAAIERLASALSAVEERTNRLTVVRIGSDGRVTRHALPALPQCRRCGSPDAGPSGDRVVLRSRTKVSGSCNGSRIMTTEETLRRVSAHVDPLFGIVRAVHAVRVPSLTAVHGYTATHAQHYGSASVVDIQEEARDHSGGKGSTDLDARVSAICESLERHSATQRGAEPTRLARASELGTEAVLPASVLGFSERQYEERGAWNAEQGDGFQWVPEPYRDEPIEWSPTRSLISGRRRWIPSGHLFLAFRGRGRRFCVGDSNGLAAGNCLEEAVLQGLLELVERDAVALWWYNRVRRPRVDMEALADPWCVETERQLRAMGRTLWALDLTHDFRIPVVAAVSAERGREVVFGFGAHLDRRIAVRRALTEASQMLGSLGSDRGGSARSLGAHFPDAIAWWNEATLESEPYLEPLDRALGDRKAWDPTQPHPDPTGDTSASADLLDELTRCLSRLEAAGVDVLVHDLTRPDVDLPVVRVVAPGLRHFWRRLGPGRLYDVPVRLGWVSCVLAESELNPRSIFV